MIRKPCSKCGTTDYPKFIRKRIQNLTGKRGSRVQTETMHSWCVLCQKEEVRVVEQRRLKKKLAYNRAWKKRNREKWNAYNRKWYNKKYNRRKFSLEIESCGMPSDKRTPTQRMTYQPTIFTGWKRKTKTN